MSGVKANEAVDKGVKFPDVKVQLSGQNGNAYFIAGKVGSALKKAGHADGAKAFYAAVEECKSYDELLWLAMRTVEVM